MFEKITDRNKMAQLKAELQQLSTEYKKATIFDKELLPKDFCAIVRKCFKFASPAQLNVSLEDYFKMKENTTPEFTLLDMGTILYVLQQRTQNELVMTDVSYSNFLKMVANLVHAWQKVIIAEEGEIANRLEEKAIEEMEAAKEHKTIPLPATAEA